MAQSLLVSVNCPNCGGILEIEEGSRYQKCPYCGVKLYVHGDEGYRKIFYAMNVDKNSAMRSVRKWLSEGFKARNLKNLAKFEEVYPIYVPFWSVNARVVGWVCGYNIETYVDSRGNVRRKKVPKEEMVLRDYMWSVIACDPGDIGVKHLRNFVGKAIPVGEEGIPKFDVTTSKEDALKVSEKELKKRAVREADVENVTFQKLFFLPKSITQINYPFWIVRYKYRGKGYFATVDGVTGRVIAGRAPGDPLWRSLAIASSSVIGGAAFSLIALGRNIGFYGAIAGIIIFLMGYAFFRHGMEIVEGDIPKKYKSPVKISKGTINIGDIRIGV